MFLPLDLQSETAPARDEAAALRVVGGNRALADELFASFLRDLRPQLERMRQLQRCQDWAELSEAAHQLRGSAVYCGTVALKLAARTLEQVASRPDDPCVVGTAMDWMESEMKRVEDYTPTGI